MPLPAPSAPPSTTPPVASSLPSVQVQPEPPRDGSATARMPRRKPRWLVPVALGAAAALLVLIGVVWGISAWLDASAMDAIRAAAQDAGDSGLRGDIEAVVAQIDDEDPDEPELAALKARLLATLTLEHGEDHVGPITAALAHTDGEVLTDAAIAASLVHLANGDPAAALQRLSGLPAQGEQIGEAFRARLYATAALGRLEEAEEAAAQAAALRPNAPRHVALRALMRHRLGDSAGALDLLQSVPNGDASPSVRATRARVLWESGRDRNGALSQATALIDELADRATPYQLAWAHLIRAEHAQLQRGDSVTALREAHEAAEHVPPLDEPFGMQLVSTLLATGAAQEADAQLARLPSPPVDIPARALLTAEVALAVGRLDAVDAALAEAPEGPPRTLLQGELLEARGRPGQARPLYERAMEAPGAEGIRARIPAGRHVAS